MAIRSPGLGPPQVSQEALKKLEGSLKGDVLRPGLPGYDPARALFNAMIDKHPAFIIRCRHDPDVLRALEFARSQNLPLAVRGGGHNVSGKASCDQGVVIDLSLMKGIQVDPAARIARAEAGLTWGEFDAETQAHGLATTGGFISTTGIAGLTLGGGLGWLMRKHGMACDNLQAVRIVSADGQLRSASESENPDLFWGVRGGGGNFGIVTSFTYRLHPVGRMLAGVVFFPLQQAATALRAYRDIMASAPDEVMAYAVLLTSPEGVRMFAIPVCYAGPLERAEAALHPLRSIGQPAADQVQPMGYLDIQRMFDPAFPAGRLNYWKSSFLRELSDPAIDTLVRYFETVPSALTAVALEPFGGALSRVPADATAFPHRDARFSIVIVSTWTDPDATPANTAWTRELWSALQPYSTGGVYVNYLDADDGARVESAYQPATYQRLRQLKQKYDPENVFRSTQNIGPGS